MGIKDLTTSAQSPQIHRFPVENQPPRLSIHIENAETGALYAEYYSMVYNRCFFILHNEEDARDVAQDVFTKIQELKSNGGLEILYPKTYLSTVAKNMSINKKNKARREVNDVYDMATGESINRCINEQEENNKYSPEKEFWESGIIAMGYEKAEAQNIVQAILNEQDETTRKIYFYKYRDDMTLEQIGEVVGLRKSAVHKRIKHLEEQIRLKMGRAGK